LHHREREKISAEEKQISLVKWKESQKKGSSYYDIAAERKRRKKPLPHQLVGGETRKKGG